MAMTQGLRPLNETLNESHYASMSGAYDIYVQDEYGFAEQRTYYIAKWMKLEAGSYTIRYYMDDFGTLSLDGVLVTELPSPVEFNVPLTGSFSVAESKTYRMDMTYTEAAPNETPAYLAYALYREGVLVEVSRANDWVGDIIPIPDSALGDKPPYNDDYRLSYPIFLAPPDYSSTVIERLEWLTDVLTSESGAEQRRKLRQYPRRSIEANFLAHGNARAMIDNYITGVGSSLGLVPLWFDRSKIFSKSVGGSVDIFADIEYRDFNVNDVVIIRRDDAFDYELNIVAEKHPQHLVLAYGLQRDVQAGTTITPVRVCRIMDMPNGTNVTDTVRQYAIRFTTTEAPIVEPAWNLPVYSRTNLAIFDRVPNFKASIALSFERQTYDWDNTIGNIYRRDPGGQAFTGIQGTYHIQGREDMHRFKQLLYKLCGRQREIHVPTLQDDIVLARDIEPGLGALVAYRSGYQQFGTSIQNVRRDILIESYDGTLHPNTVISARVVGDEEWLFLSETIPAIPKEQVRRISYMPRSRLDIDGVEINRVTDSDGVSQVSLSFRSMSERRDATPTT